MTQSAQAMVDLYLAAEKDVLAGKSTTINGRTFATENLQEIRDGRQEWERRALQERLRATGRKSGGPALANFSS
ncbi:primosomal replication protein PriB/PriC domain protein [Microbulbifer sp. TYP-18]|uniref:primosomal replication protein PriB/PriC domain protein n=1 Tax=Microbulbifer sp. TYP-18 TaxID=3230024 RepID=UPI0034C60224